VREVEIVKGLPLLELRVEPFGVVNENAFEHPVELLDIDPMPALDLPFNRGVAEVM
jgi:hypothetical protein